MMLLMCSFHEAPIAYFIEKNISLFHQNILTLDMTVGTENFIFCRKLKSFLVITFS